MWGKDKNSLLFISFYLPLLNFLPEPSFASTVKLKSNYK